MQHLSAPGGRTPLAGSPVTAVHRSRAGGTAGTRAHGDDPARQGARTGRAATGDLRSEGWSGLGSGRHGIPCGEPA